jgi:hypothetical protein
MLRNSAKVFLLFSAALFLTNTSKAQNIGRAFENAPYSKYGLGEEMNSITPALRAIGSITAAYSDPYIINTDNPASYASIKNTTYEAGMEARSRTVIAGDSRYRTGAASLSYLNIAIPAGKYAGFSLGYRPQTKVSYTLEDTIQTAGIGNTVNHYNGDGGLNYFYVGGAGTYKGFSLGVNVGYNFGTIQNSSWFNNIDTTYVNNSEFTKYSHLGGLTFKLGALYETKISKGLTLKVGGTFDASQKINAQLDEFWISHPIFTSDTIGADTAYSSQGLKTKLSLPMRFAIGIQLVHNDVWTVGVNYSYTDWSQYNNNNVKDSIGKNAYKFAVGGEITPNATNIYKYWERVTYRLGFYYGKDYVSINQEQMNYYGVTFGLSLPFKRSTDRIHTSMELGKMGKSGSNLLQQNFARFSMGITLNSKWFEKRKYD